MRPEGTLPDKPVTEDGNRPKRPFSPLRLLLALLIGAGISGLFYWLGDLLGLSRGEVSRRAYFACAAMLAALIALALWAKRRNRFSREAAALLPLLESDPDAYIAGYEALRRQWKGAFYQRYICLNLVAGYFEREDYAAAERLLQEAGSRGLPGRTRTVWASDMAMCAFRQERWTEGLAVMEREKKAMEALSTAFGSADSGGAPNAWWLLCLYRLIARGETERAREALPKVEERFTGARAQRSLSHIRDVLARTEGAGRPYCRST